MDTSLRGHDEASRARRAASFGAVAASYAEHRPNYPDPAVEWALRPLANRGDLRVLDLGAGTGKLSEALISRGVDVVAVEPNSAMLDEFRRRLPHVSALLGSAESIPLPDQAVDAVLIGQAFHWFDHTRALPEIARVLRPGGVLAPLWNLYDDRVTWVADLARLVGNPAVWSEFHDKPVALAQPFRTVCHAEFPHYQLRTADSMLATIQTYSQVLTATPHDRRRLLSTAEKWLRSCPHTASGEFRLPMVTIAARALLPEN